MKLEESLTIIRGLRNSHLFSTEERNVLLRLRRKKLSESICPFDQKHLESIRKGLEEHEEKSLGSIAGTTFGDEPVSETGKASDDCDSGPLPFHPGSG